MILISNIKLELDEDISDLEIKVKKKLKLSIDEKLSYQIAKESIDARKGKVTFVYQVLVKNHPQPLINDKDVQIFEDVKEETLTSGEIKLKNNPVVIGLGPAGLFAALTLAQNGYKPVVYELGRDVDARTEDVVKFWENGILDERSNVQFGEGGAGAFSDGKLTTRIKDPRVKNVLAELYRFGGPEDIIYSHKAHIGTDILKTVVKNIRNEIISLGGKVNFESKLEDIDFNGDGSLKSISVNGETVPVEAMILAIGNSARETYKMLYNKQVDLIPKAFAVGFRIEHPRIEIDKAQYKEHYDHPKLKTASYNLTYRTLKERNCYTFCMCPGGQVIGAASAANQVVVNGMSYHNRAEENSNSAVLCSVNESDYGKDILAGLMFQEEIERKAYVLGGSNFCAPVQRVEDFLLNRDTQKIGIVKPSYKPGYKFANLNHIYSEEITEALKESIIAYGKKISAFRLEDGILTGVETRSSAPIRIVRNESLMASNNFGLFPSGEGAGYAGGIISSAVDGIKSAQALIKLFFL